MGLQNFGLYWMLAEKGFGRGLMHYYQHFGIPIPGLEPCAVKRTPLSADQHAETKWQLRNQQTQMKQRTTS
jgi:hypothetical protein